jgi:hypothetical protein
MRQFGAYRKHRNVPCYVEGKRFASQKEGRRYKELLLLEAAGEITHLKTHQRFPLLEDEGHKFSYECDFCYRDREGRDHVEDVKGRKDPADPVYRLFRLKKALVWKFYRIRVEEI